MFLCKSKPSLFPSLPLLSAVFTPIIYKPQGDWKASGCYFELMIPRADILRNNSLSTYFPVLRAGGVGKGVKVSRLGAAGGAGRSSFCLRGSCKMETL